MAEGPVGGTHATPAGPGPGALHDFPCPFDLEACCFHGFPAAFELSGDGAIACHSAANGKQGGQGLNGTDVVCHVEHHGVEALWSSGRDAVNHFLDQAFEVGVLGSVGPRRVGSPKVGEANRSVFGPWLDRDVVPVGSERARDVQAKSRAPKPCLQHHVVPANPKPGNEDTYFFEAKRLPTTGHAAS